MNSARAQSISREEVIRFYCLKQSETVSSLTRSSRALARGRTLQDVRHGSVTQTVLCRYSWRVKSYYDGQVMERERTWPTQTQWPVDWAYSESRPTGLLYSKTSHTDRLYRSTPPLCRPAFRKTALKVSYVFRILGNFENRPPP